jgi:peroxiredoxin
MKKLFYSGFLLLLIAASCVNGHNKFTINGTVAGRDTGWVFLHKISPENKMIAADSVKLEKGKFKFTGTVVSPELYLLTVKGVPGAKPFFIDNGEISFTVKTDSIDKSVVTGSKSNDEYTAYKLSQAPFNKAMEAAYSKYVIAENKKDTTLVKAIEKEYDSINKNMTNASINYVLKNKQSVVAAFVASNMLYELSLGKLDTIVKNFSGSLSKNNYVIKIKEQAEALRNVQIGKPAPEIALNDTTGKPLKLSSLKGKYVLIDFWASWCGPCRAENPNVVKAFNKFGEKGFTVYGVSLDDNKEKWVNAIKKDGLAWTHVSDLKKWANAAAKQYAVMSIPANFLLDKEGKIIASNLRGEDLEKKLGEIFAPPVPTPAPVTSK